MVDFPKWLCMQARQLKNPERDSCTNPLNEGECRNIRYAAHRSPANHTFTFAADAVVPSRPSAVP